MGTTQVTTSFSSLDHVPEKFHYSSKKLSDATTFFDAYFTFSADSELSVLNNRWCVITCVGALLARNFWLPFGIEDIYPNMYCMLIGDPGARKSTAIKQAKRVLRSAGYETFSASRTSKEKLLVDLEAGSIDWELEDGTGQIDPKNNTVMRELFGESADLTEVRSMFIVADEYKGFAGSHNLDLSVLLGELWDYDGIYRSRIKNGKSIAIPNPNISILGGATHATFAACFPPEAIEEGFLSRMILVYGEASGKKCPWPAVPSNEDKQFLVDWLIRIKETVVGAATLAPAAHKALGTIYTDWKDIADARFRHYSSRRHTHLLKLCLVIAATRLSTEISLEDVILANSILTFTEQLMPRALGEFGKARNSPVAGKILSALYAARGPLQLLDLYKAISTEVERYKDVYPIVESLLHAEKIMVTPAGFLPVATKHRTDAKFVDLSLLPEFYLA